MNKDLYGEVIYLPKEVLDNLTVCFQYVPNSDQNTEGHRRNEELRKNGYVTYQQLGRIKNYFDNYDGDKKDYPFILNGGDYMKTWVDQFQIESKYVYLVLHQHYAHIPKLQKVRVQ